MAMVEDFKAQRKIHMRFATQIVLSTAAELRELPTLVDVHVPDEASFTVCGVRRQLPVAAVCRLNPKPCTG